jgi:hypothetical protein
MILHPAGVENDRLSCAKHSPQVRKKIGRFALVAWVAVDVDCLTMIRLYQIETPTL